MRFNSTTLVLIVLLSLFSGCSKVELKMDLEKEKTYGLEQSIGQMIRQSGQLFQQSITFNYDYSPMEIMANGDMKVRVILRRIRYDAIYPYGKTEQYDSQTDISKQPPKLMGDIYVFLLNEPLSMTLQTNGSVSYFGGLNRLLDNYVNSMPGSQAMNANALRQQYNDETFRASMNALFHLFPDHPVAEGGSWEIEGKMNMKGKTDFENKISLEKYQENGEATLKFETPIELKGVEGNIMGVVGTLDVKGTKSGTLRLDARSGWPIEGSTTQTYDGYISNPSSHTAIWVQNVVSLKGRLP